MRSACLAALLAALAATFVTGAGAGEQRAARSTVAERAELGGLLARIDATRDVTWRWQRLMRRRRTPSAAGASRIRSIAYAHWVLRRWTVRARRAERQALNPPHKQAWLCIHRYEARWSDPDGPYYGGLQMDLGFQATYGADLLRRKGTADHWSPLEQMWVAERAFRTRGFWPWPTTARSCGLI